VSYQTIECELKDGLYVIRQNRSDKLNARNSQMYVEIMAALADASAREDTAAVLLTAKGRFFSAGMDFDNDPKLAYETLPTDGAGVRDIKSALPEQDPTDLGTWLAVRFIEAFINFDKLLVGAANGPAIGEGFSSLLHCDIVYAADTAYFWAPFARAGVAPEFCSTELMAQRLGDTLANASLYLGRRISAEQAQSAGFVLDVVPHGEGFEDAVVRGVQEGLQLAGPPEMRARTLKQYKTLIRDEHTRRHLLDVCRNEFELIRERGRSGETRMVQRYYARELPGTD
jgi:enoyl-CoA hydratase/carnithine racemase